MSLSGKIGRTINECVCNCILVEKDNSISRKQVTIYGDYKAEKWLSNAVKRKLNNENVLIESYTKRSYYYSMDIETFIKNATKKESLKE